MKIYACAGISPVFTLLFVFFLAKRPPDPPSEAVLISQFSRLLPEFDLISSQSIRVSGFSSLEFLYLGGTYSFRRDLSHNLTAAQDTAQNRHSFPAHRVSGAIPSATPYYLIYDNAKH